MNTFHSEKGWRRLRSKEVMAAGDVVPAGFGCYNDIPKYLIGRKVAAGDEVFRARKRRVVTAPRGLTN